MLTLSSGAVARGHGEEPRVVRSAAAQAAQVDPAPTPTGPCGPGSKPETGMQGRVPPEDHASGRAARGYTCNTETIGRAGVKGGFRVERYVDGSGRECAYYDTTVLFPTNAFFPSGTPTGTDVLDMSDPTQPAVTATLLTPAMQSPHESVSVNQERGLLAAVLGTPAFAPGVLDVYDVSQDCRAPVLMSSLPVGILGHEGNFAPDGLTYYASALDSGEFAAIDVSNPRLPVPLWRDRYVAHGMSVSDDGKRVYLATRSGLVILDTTQIQDRVLNPTVPVVSTLDWYPMSTPQVAIPVTIGGKPYVVEVDEFGSDSDGDELEDLVGAARVIDIGDEAKPRVISNLRLDVHTRSNRAAISGDENFEDYGGFQGYAGHYCSVPQRKDPGIVACTFIESGLRVFDIRDPHNPKEIAYHNEPRETTFPNDDVPTTYAMSTVAFVPERSELWYADGNTGFIVVRVTNGVWPFPPPQPVSAPELPKARGEELPATGGGLASLVAAVFFVGGLGLRRWLRPPYQRSTDLAAARKF